MQSNNEKGVTYQQAYTVSILHQYKERTHMNIALSLIKSSTDERFPKTWFITIKKKTPTLQQHRTEYMKGDSSNARIK